MKMQTTIISKSSKRKHPNKRIALQILAHCPTAGAGWCPYPFSPSQLVKRLKRKLEPVLKTAPLDPRIITVKKTSKS